MFDLQRFFNHLGSKPQRLNILIASMAVNTDRDIVKKFSNNWQSKHLHGIGDGVARSHKQLFPEKLPYSFEEQERFSNRKTLGSIRAIALDDKMYMLKTMSSLKSRS